LIELNFQNIKIFTNARKKLEKNKEVLHLRTSGRVSAKKTFTMRNTRYNSNKYEK